MTIDCMILSYACQMVCIHFIFLTDLMASSGLVPHLFFAAVHVMEQWVIGEGGDKSATIHRHISTKTRRKCDENEGIITGVPHGRKNGYYVLAALISFTQSRQATNPSDSLV